MEKVLEKLKLRMGSSPLVRLLGIEILEMGHGHARLSMEVEEKHLNSLGTIHGGVMASLNDVACGIAVNTLLIPWATSVSLDLRVEFIRPISQGTVLCKGRVSEKKTQVAFAHSRIIDERGKLLSTASATYFIKPFKEK